MASKKKAKKKAKKSAKKKAKRKAPKRKTERLTESFCSDIEDVLEQIESDVEMAIDEFTAAQDALKELNDAREEVADAIKGRDPEGFADAMEKFERVYGDASDYTDNWVNPYADDVDYASDDLRDLGEEPETEVGLLPKRKKKKKKKARKG